MHSTIAITGGLLATAASAANTAFVNNNCTFPVFLSTAGGNSPPTSMTLAPGGNFSQPIAGSGAALMLSPTQGGADNELDYSLTSSLFYALGGNQGFTAFQEYGVSIVPSDATCQSIVCQANATDCPVGQTFACALSSNADLTFTACLYKGFSTR